ncbi:MAG TPA: hypothetical protein VJ184_06510 [Chryseolinea sp.]|nr:hypothetical protein [Chryseolinea sp.]
MKKLNLLTWLTALSLLTISSSFAPVEHGVYVQLHPDNNKKIVIQIVPDKTYSNVVAYINFYSANNKRVAQKAYSLSDGKEKYIRKDQCTNRVFKFSFDETVTRVKIDHVSEGEVLGKESASSKGAHLNLPISESALGPIER